MTYAVGDWVFTAGHPIRKDYARVDAFIGLSCHDNEPYYDVVFEDGGRVTVYGRQLRRSYNPEDPT
jgi:hypothetical protein